MTAKALRYYAMGLPAYGLYKIFSPTFFVLDRGKIPILISVFSIAFNIMFCTIFVPRYGFHILALGTSLSILLNFLLQSCFLYKLLELNYSFFIGWRVIKYFLASICLYFFSNYLVKTFLSGSNFGFADFFTRFLFVGISSIGLYLLLILVLGEYDAIRQGFKKRR